MSFPFDLNSQPLAEGDLERFGPEFADIVTAYLPSRQVRFAGPQASGELSAAWRAGVEMVRDEQKPVVESGAEAEHLYLPLWTDSQLFGVAILDNPPGTYRDHASSQLLEKGRLISAEMARIKPYALDSVTGLPGGRMLARRLQGLLPARPFSLLLVEIHPSRARDGGQALTLIARSGAFLDSLLGHLFTPCHLGHGIFGLLWENLEVGATLKMADMLLRWLKREGFARSWIGIRSFAPTEIEVGCETLLNQGWEALCIARKRGPFALCSYEAVSGRATHPLCPMPAKVLARLSRLWKESGRFALVLLRADGTGDPVEAAAPQQGLGAALVALNERECFAYLEGADWLAAETWCRDFQTQARGSFSMGIALYPEHGFKKVEVAGNSRKALLHTAFFGPGSMTVFSGVSLNISGDIYYNEGDLARAAREYRLGLQLDPKNINLLNSLGVTLAQMNLYRRAIPLFEEALALDPANFMALFNLGFAYLAVSNEQQALENFEKALKQQDDNFDLLLQLGKLYCRAGRWESAVQVLRRGEQARPSAVRDISHGAVHRFLGEAYQGLGRHELAMASLQRAARHNPRDAAALSMLGELYFLEQQGNEIALALCRQAVELDDDDWRHWSRLGAVLLGQNDAVNALAAIRKALSLAGKNSRLLTQLAAVYEQRGKTQLARKVYAGVLRSDPQCMEAAERLAALGQPEY